MPPRTPRTVKGMRRIPALATASVVLALALAGCSPATIGTDTPAASSTTAPSESAEATTGDRITGDGYSFIAPEGWGIPDGQAVPDGVDTAVADVTDTDGFADNINVVLSPAGEVTNEQVETIGVQELETGGATDVQVLERVTVAGVESSHLTALLASSGSEFRVDQYYPTNAGQTYVVTFTFNDDVAEADRTALAQSVFATWEWTA